MRTSVLTIYFLSVRQKPPVPASFDALAYFFIRDFSFFSPKRAQQSFYLTIVQLTTHKEARAAAFAAKLNCQCTSGVFLELSSIKLILVNLPEKMRPPRHAFASCIPGVSSRGNGRLPHALRLPKGFRQRALH